MLFKDNVFADRPCTSSTLLRVGGLTGRQRWLEFFSDLMLLRAGHIANHGEGQLPGGWQAGPICQDEASSRTCSSWALWGRGGGVWQEEKDQQTCRSLLPRGPLSGNSEAFSRPDVSTFLRHESNNGGTFMLLLPSSETPAIICSNAAFRWKKKSIGKHN